MLFTPELRELIAQGKKTQTRRPVKAGETLTVIEAKKTVRNANGRIKMQVGRDYSVQYGYGLPCVWHDGKGGIISHEKYIQYGIDYLTHIGMKPMRYILLDIRKEPVADISLEDTIAEGFKTREDFWAVWRGFYGDSEPMAWVYTFKVQS